MRSRVKVLSDLIQLKGNLLDLQNELAQYPWDCENPLFIMNKKEIKNILLKCLSKEITIHELVEWAAIIECRDDIDFNPEVLQEIIFEIASPALYGEINDEKLGRLLLKLV